MQPSNRGRVLAMEAVAAGKRRQAGDGMSNRLLGLEFPSCIAPKPSHPRRLKPCSCLGRQGSPASSMRLSEQGMDNPVICYASPPGLVPRDLQPSVALWPQGGGSCQLLALTCQATDSCGVMEYELA